MAKDIAMVLALGKVIKETTQRRDAHWTRVAEPPMEVALRTPPWPGRQQKWGQGSGYRCTSELLVQR